MFDLPLTRQLCELFGPDALPWPRTTSAYYGGLPEAFEALAEVLEGRPETAGLTYRMALDALDEWLLTTAFDSLSISQRAVCACGLLETFARGDGWRPTFPNVRSAIRAIGPSYAHLDAKAREILLSVCRLLDQSPCDLDDEERAFVSIARFCLGASLGVREVEPADATSARNVLLEEACNSERWELKKFAEQVLVGDSTTPEMKIVLNCEN